MYQLTAIRKWMDAEWVGSWIHGDRRGIAYSVYITVEQ